MRNSAPGGQFQAEGGPAAGSVLHPKAASVQRRQFGGHRKAQAGVARVLAGVSAPVKAVSYTHLTLPTTYEV